MDDDFHYIQYPDSFLEDFICSEDKSLDVLASLDTTKTNGPENEGKFCNILFNISLDKVPQVW